MQQSAIQATSSLLCDVTRRQVGSHGHFGPIISGPAVQWQRGGHRLPSTQFFFWKRRWSIQIGHDGFLSCTLIIGTIDAPRLLRSADLPRSSVSKLLMKFQSGWQSALTMRLTNWCWRISVSRAILDHVEQWLHIQNKLALPGHAFKITLVSDTCRARASLWTDCALLGRLLYRQAST